MTHDTSAHGGGLSGRWVDAGHNRAFGAWRRRAAEADWRIDWARVAGRPAPLQLLALSATAGLLLGLSINASWAAAADGGSGGPAALYLAALIAPCVVAAIVVLRRGERTAQSAPRQDRSALEAPTQLLAQMHHELRTPLNAMIGFSEVMLRELHGPLGNARYQEYAAHISESGGRLLKASEDALAVAATMSALVADRRALRRERLPAAVLLRDAWVESLAANPGIRLRMDNSGAADIECDRQATSEALHHLLGEAIARMPSGGAITARAGARRIEIMVEPAAPARKPMSNPVDGPGEPLSGPDAGGRLRLILARSLIEMQGATLSLRTGPQAEGWTAHIAFPASTRGERRQHKPRSTAGARWPAPPARRGGFVPASAAAAARASAGIHAVPPA